MIVIMSMCCCVQCFLSFSRSEPCWQLLQCVSMFVHVCGCVCGLAFNSLWMMDDGCCEIQWEPKWKSNSSVDVCIQAKSAQVLRVRAWIHAFYLHTRLLSQNTQLHVVWTHGKTWWCKHTHTHATSLVRRPADLQVSFTAIEALFHSSGKRPLPHFFPQSLLPPPLLFPWPLASFTTHINTQRPPGNTVPDPCHHRSTANQSPWQCDCQMLRWMPGWANGRAESGCHAPWDPAEDQLKIALGRKGECNATGAHKHAHALA